MDDASRVRRPEDVAQLEQELDPLGAVDRTAIEACPRVSPWRRSITRYGRRSYVPVANTSGTAG